MARKPPGKKPRYLDTRNPADMEALGRDIEETLNAKGPITLPKPLPSFDPFADWWDNLPEATQLQLAARAEDFVNLEDFFYSYMGKGMDFGSFGGLTREWILRNLDAIIADPKMRSDPKYARGGIEHFLGIAKDYLNRLFGIRAQAHRPVQHLDRDRKWSKLNYEGHSYPQIADRHFEATGKNLGEEFIRTTVDRHRKRRKSLTLFIAHAIWSLESGKTFLG